jgi:cell pole-organizing protein PopZ
MSQSKPAGGTRTKEKAKPVTAKKKADAAVTVRVIEAPQPAVAPAMALTPAEEQRSAKAMALAAEIEQAIKGTDGHAVLAPEAVQALIAALCKVYSAHSEGGERYDAFSLRNPVTPTDVMVTASGLLKAANLAVFELGMWQSWTGR